MYDFTSLVGKQSHSNLNFIVGNEVIPGNKSLVLHRILDKE
jgi:hypothetical protein